MGKGLVCLVTGASAGVLLSHHLKVLKSEARTRDTETKEEKNWNEHLGIGLHTVNKLVASGATVLLHARFQESL